MGEPIIKEVHLKCGMILEYFRRNVENKQLPIEYIIRSLSYSVATRLRNNSALVTNEVMAGKTTLTSGEDILLIIFVFR